MGRFTPERGHSRPGLECPADIAQKRFSSAQNFIKISRRGLAKRRECPLLIQSGHVLVLTAILCSGAKSIGRMPRLSSGVALRRREFIKVVAGSAAVWPLAAQAQPAAMPLIGFLNPYSADGQGERLRGFRQGLGDAGYVEGNNLSIDYRWAEGQFDRLSGLQPNLLGAKSRL